MGNKNDLKAMGLALLAILFWSTMSSAFKLTLRYAEFDTMLLWASISGTAGLLIIGALAGQPLNISTLKKQDWLNSALMGFFNPFLYYLVLFKAYQLLEAQLAGTLNYLWPIALVILSSLILKQKISLLSYVGLTVSFVGLMVISTNGTLDLGNMADPLGVVLAAGSALIWAAYWIINMRDKRPAVPKITLNILFGLLYLIIYMMINQRPWFPHHLPGWGGSIYIGLFELSITFVIWLRALQLAGNTALVSNLVYLSPLAGLFFIHTLVGENIRTATIGGLLLILAGILLQQWSIHRVKDR